MAFIVEQAGGKASDGFGRIMEILKSCMKEYLSVEVTIWLKSRGIHA
jgi:fructose-1,6-bisphosphatase